MNTFNRFNSIDRNDSEADHWETAAEWEALMNQYER